MAASVVFSLDPIAQPENVELALPAQKVRQIFLSHNLRGWFGIRSDLQENLSKVSAKELSAILNEFFENLDGKDPLSLLDDLAEAIPPQKLDALIQDTLNVNPLESMKKMVDAAKHYLEKTKKAESPHVSSYVIHFFDGCVAIFESILGAFGIADFFKQNDGEFQQDIKLQRIMTQIMLFTMLLTMLMPVLGPVEATKIVGGSFASIWALSVIYPCLKRKPARLPKFENWSKKVEFAELPCPEGRQIILDRIASCLTAAKKEKQHVLILGESGIGKTETLKALAHAIEKGQYPELKGLQIFYANTADLVTHREPFGGGNKILSHIKNSGALTGTVQILDEIHTACKDENPFADQLKTELDSGGCFQTVIGVTTELEYLEHIKLKNPALARRFKIVNIDKTDENETLTILNNYILKEFPEALLANGDVLRDLIKQSGGDKVAQPLRALDLLRECIKRTREHQKSPEVIKLEEVRRQIETDVSTAAAVSYLPEAGEPKEDLVALRAKIVEQNQQRESLFQMRANMGRHKKEMFELISESADVQLTDQKMNKIILQAFFFLPKYTQMLQKKAEKLSLQLFIDDKLLESTAGEMAQERQRTEDLMQKAKVKLKDNIQLQQGLEPTERKS